MPPILSAIGFMIRILVPAISWGFFLSFYSKAGKLNSEVHMNTEWEIFKAYTKLAIIELYRMGTTYLFPNAYGGNMSPVDALDKALAMPA